MLKKHIALNSLIVAFEIFINMGLKVVLAHITSPENLVFYYSAMDCIMFFVMFHSGFKDSLILAFNQYEKSYEVFQYYKKWFIFIFALLFFVILPFSIPLFLKKNYSLSWVDRVIIDGVYFANIVFFYTTYKLIALRKYKEVSIFTFYKSILFIVLLGVYYQFSQKVGYIELLILSFVAPEIVSIIFLRRAKIAFNSMISRKRSLEGFKRKFLSNTGIASAEYILESLFLYFSTILYVQYFSLSDLADFQVVARPIYIAALSVFSYPIFRFLYPEFANMVNQKQFDNIARKRRKFMKYVIAFGVVFVGAFLLMSKFLVQFVFPSPYKEAYHLINYLILAVPFSILSSYSYSFIKACGEFKLSLALKFFGSIFYFLCFYILMRKGVGPLSVIYAMIGNVFLIAIMGHFFEGRMLRKKLDEIRV